MRGCFIVFARASRDDALASSSVQLIDYVSRKQKHVCRTTLAAEFFVALDTADMLMMLNVVGVL
eukprot:6289230-Lingulodinium_polyedra.AAC.1